MKKLMNLKFKKGIQERLNDLFSDEEYHEYTLGEFLKIMAFDILFIIAIVVLMFVTCL